MSLKTELMELLSDYDGFDATEDNHIGALRQFLNSTDQPFFRSNLDGHVTVSALVISPTGDKTLLMQHAEPGKSIQFGGHIDETDDSVLGAAIREAEEESGISGMRPYATGIFDIDSHPIPHSAKKNEPGHTHYDVRFLLVAPHEQIEYRGESKDLKWFGKGEIQTHDNPSIARMIQKWQIITE